MMIALMAFGGAPAWARDDDLLLCEVAMRPGSAEFIEVVNLTGTTIELDDYYLADHHDYALLPAAVPALHASDFIVKFPDGFDLEPCEVKVVAFSGSGFFSDFGARADFEIKVKNPVDDDPLTPNMVLIRGGSSSTGLSDSGEMLVLFRWDGASDLVSDVDMIRLGDPDSAANDLGEKDDLAVDGPDADSVPSFYRNDRMTMPRIASVAGNYKSTKRVLLEIGESHKADDDEWHGGGNGTTGDDETTEDIARTWDSEYGFVASDPWICRPTVDCYYHGVDASTRDGLWDDLHGRIKDHVWSSYDKAWEILALADEDPNDESMILDVYKNASYSDTVHTGYNREHSWPKTYGFKIDGQDADNDTAKKNYPYSDCHHLFLADASYNQTGRNARLYRTCDATCTPWTTLANDGRGGGTTGYPADSNWQSGPQIKGTWETWVGRRGDVARAQFYLDLRYEGEVHPATGSREPNLILTDVEDDIVSEDLNQLEARMGIKADLLDWHRSDPPDWREARRNDRVSWYQRNRNPFIDHPEWVDCLFTDPPGSCLSGSADLSVSKDDGEDQVDPGQTLTYVIEVGNSGPDDARWARVLDPLDEALFDALATTWSCAPAPASGLNTRCPAAGDGRDLRGGVYVDVESGDSVVLTVTATVKPEATGLVVNRALVSLPVGLVDGDPDDDGASDRNLLTGPCGAPFVLPLDGQTVTWTETLTACDLIDAAGFVVGTTGDVVLRAGREITFGDDFQLLSGARMVAEIDPALAPP